MAATGFNKSEKGCDQGQDMQLMSGEGDSAHGREDYGALFPGQAQNVGGLT
jgi:hypothetical protein